MVVEGKTDEHIYYDVIAPALEYLEKDDNLRQFLAALGPSESAFVDALRERLRECYGTTGWPFSSMNWFGSFLLQVFNAARTHDARLTCLEELWFLAYTVDQWAVQRLVHGLINNGNIPEDLAVDFAMAIAKSEVHAQKPEFSRLRMHPAIENAINSLAWS